MDKTTYSMQNGQHTIVSILERVKTALFDKSLVSVMDCGALAMCAMWVGNCFKKVRWEKK